MNTPRITIEQLADPVWRISNLYEICTEKGKIIPFRPNEKQKQILHEIFVEGHWSLLIPKSRRHGVSTLVAIMDTDAACFTEGINVAFVDKTLEDAKEKLAIAHTAILGLQKNLPGCISFRKLSNKITVSHEGKEPSFIHAGKRFRGSSLLGSLISELGTIAASEPARAKEIIDGTLPAARYGIRVIETTVKGGKKGAFYEMVRDSLAIPDSQKTRQDWHVVFLPWHEDPNNVDAGNVELASSTIAYFTMLKSRHGIECTHAQMAWWQRNKRTFQERMNQEYPSTLDEAFEVPVEGTIYDKALDEASMNGRIRYIPYDRSRPCFAFWDLGAPANTICTIVQYVDGKYHILEQDAGKPAEQPAVRAARIMNKYPTLNTNYFPHDATYGTSVGLTQHEIWEQAGLPSIIPIPKTKDVWTGINHLLSIFDRLYFDEEGTATGRSQLLSYRVAPQPKGEGYQNKPVHDYTSHWADSLRMLAEADFHGMLRIHNNTPGRSKITIVHSDMSLEKTRTIYY